MNNILAKHQNNELKVHLDDLLSNYIHMLLNRLFKNEQRKHELIIYHLMWKHYLSEIAREKQKDKVILQ